jgi:hypothetical protein
MGTLSCFIEEENYWIWDSIGGDLEYHVTGHDAVQSDRNSLTFRRNLLPPSSVCKRKSIKKPGRRRQAEVYFASLFFRPGLLFDFLFNPENGGS